MNAIQGLANLTAGVQTPEEIEAGKLESLSSGIGQGGHTAATAVFKGLVDGVVADKKARGSKKRTERMEKLRGLMENAVQRQQHLQQVETKMAQAKAAQMEMAMNAQSIEKAAIQALEFGDAQAAQQVIEAMPAVKAQMQDQLPRGSVFEGVKIVDGNMVPVGKDRQGNLVFGSQGIALEKFLTDETRAKRIEIQNKELSGQKTQQEMQMDAAAFPAQQTLREAKAQQAFAEANKADVEASQFSQPVTPGQKALDKAFAEDFVSFVQGGAADAAKNLEQVKLVKQRLDSGDNVTGAFVGSMPDFVNTVVNPKAVDTRELVEEVVQRNLREVLGAQFTEQEGERLIARAYNPKLGEKVNAERVGRLIRAMENAFENKLSAVRYYNENGTLTGWSGELPTVKSIEREVFGSQATENVRSEGQQAQPNIPTDDPLGLFE